MSKYLKKKNDVLFYLVKIFIIEINEEIRKLKMIIFFFIYITDYTKSFLFYLIELKCVFLNDYIFNF